MVKWYQSLQTRLTISFLLLISAIALGTFFYTVNEGKKAITEQMREELMLTANVMASQLDGDILASLHEGDEFKDEYWQIDDLLEKMRGDNEQIIYTYTMRINTDDSVAFVVDTDNEETYADIQKNLDEAVLIDMVYEDAPVDEIKEGLKGPYATEEPYTDEWGTFMTGYAPILDSESNAVAVLGVDFDISTVKEKQDFLSSRIYIIIAGAISAATLIILYFSSTIIKDLNKITKVAQEVSKGNPNVTIPEIKTKSEIYELNEGMKSVLAAVEFLTENVQSKSAPGGK
ncbi:MAG TPA: hypothetical protein PKL83_00795 [bacterium]|nr:hypothetical protein [bacterium]